MLGEQIRKARLAAGLTQEALAFKAGVTRNYVRLVELGTNSPTVNTLMRMCDALDVPASTLIAAVEAGRERKVGKKRP